MKIKTAVTMSLVLSSNMTWASAPDFENKQFLCPATCAVLDNTKSALYVLGNVKGTSELSEAEAFEDLKQNCHHLSVLRKMNSQSAVLIRGAVQVQKHNVQSSSNDSSSNTYSTHSESDSRYEIQLENGESCRLIDVNPKGTPKYIGSEIPMG